MPDTIFGVIAQGLDEIADSASLAAAVVSKAADEIVDAAERANRATGERGPTLNFGISGGGGGGPQITGQHTLTYTPVSLVTEINRLRKGMK
jgi:hypothetical protein